MADLSELSNEELLAIVQSDAAPALDMSQLSNEQLINIANGGATEDWSPAGALKQFGAGAVEGTTGMISLVGDLGNAMFNPASIGEARANGKSWNDALFPHSIQVQSAMDQVLPEKEDQYRYSRTAGQFVGPSVAGKARAGWAALKEIPAALSAAFGAQGLEEATGDKKIAPLVGAVAGGGVASLAGDVAKLGRAATYGATAEEIQGAAAKALRDQTGLTTSQIDDAIRLRPQDDLGALMTTAEITDNAGMAQIEKTLAGTGQRSNIYNARLAERDAAREAVLGRMSTVPAVNKEGLGSRLIETAKDTRDTLDENARRLWNEVPRHAPVDVDYAQQDLAYILASRQGGLKPGSKVMTLMDQFMEPGPKSSGALQDIRSDALALSRDANLSPFETRLLGELDDSIVKSMNSSLTGESSSAWEAAREATAEAKGTFARGTAGGALTHPDARNSNALANAFKGDSQSVEEIRAALATKPEMMEEVKRGIIQSIKRDSQDKLTADKMRQFLSANEGGIKELFGEQHYGEMTRILEDLRSSTKQRAFTASAGNSVTAQKQTVAGAIEDAVLTGLTPGGTWTARLVDQIRRGASINNADAVNELLFKAAMDPQFALMLSQTPTKARILNAFERLREAGYNFAGASGKAGAIELGRTESNIIPPSRFGGLPAQSKASQQAGTQTEPTQGGRKSQEVAGSSAGAFQQDTQSQKEPSTTKEQAAAMPHIATVDSQANPALSAVFSPANYTSAVDEVFGGSMAAPDAKLIQAVVRQESGGKADAVSPKGAVGLMQMTPIAAKDIERVYGWDASQFNPRDPEQNMKWGTKYLELMLDTFKDTKLALAAYNAGPTAVAKLVKKYGNSFDAIQPHLPRETQLYVPAIISHYSKPAKGQVVKV